MHVFLSLVWLTCAIEQTSAIGLLNDQVTEGGTQASNLHRVWVVSQRKGSSGKGRARSDPPETHMDEVQNTILGLHQSKRWHMSPEDHATWVKFWALAPKAPEAVEDCEARNLPLHTLQPNPTLPQHASERLSQKLSRNAGAGCRYDPAEAPLVPSMVDTKSAKREKDKRTKELLAKGERSDLRGYIR